MVDSVGGSKGRDEGLDPDVLVNDNDQKKSAKDVIVSSQADLEKCPCGESRGCYYITCTKCRQEWHQDCVYLQGLDDTMILLLTKWRCRYCDNPEEKFAGRGNCGIDSTVEN